jgi:hypothetical protein
MIRFAKLLPVFALLLLTTTCKDKDDPIPTRTFRMGFQASAPRFDDFDLIVRSIALWAEPGDVADAAMITTEVPWEALLDGQSAVEYVEANYEGLVEYYRAHNLKLWIYIDPANGLNRSSDSQALVAAGESIANDDMQKIYRRFVVVMDSILKPDHLGLALETNLIRLSSSPAIYSGVKKAANDVVIELKSRNSSAVLSVSIQADVAWGSLQGDFQYHGITQDLADFSFLEELGISSYPYFGYDDPKDLPHDYYSKLAEEAKLPVFVSEGGWTSSSIEGPGGDQITSSTSKQSDYILKQAAMLNEAKAIGLFSLTFTDIDLAALSPGVDPTIQYFAYLGVVDKDLDPKPAFESWKKIFSYKLAP